MIFYCWFLILPVDFSVKMMYNRINPVGTGINNEFKRIGNKMQTVCAKKRDFLHCQTRDWLVRQMRTGKLNPGSKLPGERALANLLKISRNTARTARRGLEKEGLIERIPSRGAFVRQKNEVLQAKLVLVFPEAEISLAHLQYANWLAVFEMQRGLLEESMYSKAVLSFQHFSIEDSIKKTAECADKLIKEYDAAFFIGWQFNELKDELKSRKYPFISLSSCEHFPYLMYNRYEICLESARYLIKCGARDIKLLMHDFSSDIGLVKFNAVRQACEENGIKLSKKNVIECTSTKDNEAICLELRKLFSEPSFKLPDAFYCTFPEMTFCILQLSREMNWEIPKDVILMGYGNNIRLSPMISQQTHVKLPHYEIGRTACRSILDKIISGKNIPDIQELKAELIIGKGR